MVSDIIGSQVHPCEIEILNSSQPVSQHTENIKPFGRVLPKGLPHMCCVKQAQSLVSGAWNSPPCLVPCSWSLGSYPDASLLAPSVTAPQRMAEGQAQRPRAAVLASAVSVMTGPHLA